MTQLIDLPIDHIFPIIFQNLSIQDLLTCRLVNKKFKHFSDHTNGLNKLIIGLPDSYFDDVYLYYNNKLIEDKDIISLKCFRTIQKLSIFNLDKYLKYLKIYDQQFKLEEISNLINLQSIEFGINCYNPNQQILNLNNLKVFVSNYCSVQLNSPKLEKIQFWNEIKLNSNPESIKHLITRNYDYKLEIFKNLEIMELIDTNQPMNENLLIIFKNLKQLKINLILGDYSNEIIKNSLIKILNDKIKLKRVIDIYLEDSFTSAIQLKQLYIPEQILLGSSVMLICDFKLEKGESLYSVKFYKNNLEFYRYLNSSSNHQYSNNHFYDHKDFTIFPQSGIHLDKRKSNTSHVMLKKSDFNSEGTYECEVSTTTLNTVIAAKELRIYVQPKNPLQLNIDPIDKRNINAVCQSFASKPASLIYFLLNGQLIKQPLYKYLKLGDLITSRQNEPLVSSTLSLTISKNNLAAINKIVNSIEYIKFKIDPLAKLNSIRSEINRLDTKKLNYQNIEDSSIQNKFKSSTSNHNYKTELLNDEELHNQNIKHQFNDETRFRIRRDELNNLQNHKLNKKQNRINVLNKQQTRHQRMVNQKHNDACDQLLKNCSSFQNKEITIDRIGNKTINRILFNKNGIKLNKTINQVNSLISLIEKNLILLKKNLHLKELNISSDDKNNLNILNSLNIDDSKFYNDYLNLTTLTDKQINIIKSFFYQLNLKNKTSISSLSNPLSNISTSLSFFKNLPLTSNHKLSIDNYLLPKPQALIDNQEDKIYDDELEQQDRGLELSCVSTIAQPIATTYDELSLEENNYFERKNSDSIYDLNNNEQQPIYLQDEFSIPRISINDESLISVGQILNANCTVNLIQHSSFNRLQPILKWFINDKEAHIDELIPYNNQELYDKNIRSFSSTYSAYGLFYGNLLKQLRSNNTSNASFRNQQQLSHLNDQNKFNSRLLKRKRRTLALGLNIVLNKEHFQTTDGSIKLRCTCTYSTLLKHEVQTIQLQSSSSKRSLFWFASNAKRSSFGPFLPYFENQD